MSPERSSSSVNGRIATAASATPSATPASRRSAPRTRPPGSARLRASSANSEAAASEWKLDSGCPPKNCSATTSARPATGSGPGRRAASHTPSHSHGSHAHTLLSGHDSQTTNDRLNANTTPASSAPANPVPSRRDSAYVPSAAQNSFSAAIRPSDHQNGRTSAGQVNGENSADCALATNGRPAMMCGFHSGAPGSSARAYCMNGWNTSTASACS